jgi:MraZ protein
MVLPSLNAGLLLDEKGRVGVPRLLRNALELEGCNQFVAFANGGPRRGLAFYTVPDFRSLQARHSSDDLLDPKTRLFALAINATAQTVSIDGAGRLLIPQQLRNLVGLDRELFLFTSGQWFEIWDRKKWEQEAWPQAAELWDELYGFGSLTSPPSSPPAPSAPTS